MSSRPRTRPVASNDPHNSLDVIWSAPDKDGNQRILSDRRAGHVNPATTTNQPQTPKKYTVSVRKPVRK